MILKNLEKLNFILLQWGRINRYAFWILGPKYQKSVTIYTTPL